MEGIRRLEEKKRPKESKRKAPTMKGGKKLKNIEQSQTKRAKEKSEAKEVRERR